MKGAVDLNRLLLKFVLLCHVDIRESSREENAKFNFLGIIWESKRSKRVLFAGFREPKIQYFPSGIHNATMVYRLQCKSLVLSYPEVGTFIIFINQSRFYDFFHVGNSKMFNITSKYFSIFNNEPLAS